MGNISWRATVRVATLAMAACAVTGIVGVAPSGSAAAVEVSKLAIMTPEDPTDFGWNQQGFDAAQAVAQKYRLAFMPATGLGYGDVHPQARELADGGASLIIAHASGATTPPLRKSAPKDTCRWRSSIGRTPTSRAPWSTIP